MTGSLTLFVAGLSTAADEELLPAAEASGKVASCPTSAQQAAKRKNWRARPLKLPRGKRGLKLFMECELLMLVYLMPILPETQADTDLTSGSIFEYA
jgi:hypothetical protein